MILKIIKTRLEASKGLWPKELSGVLLAYRTTPQSLIRETSFAQAFGSEAIIPIEVGLTNLKTRQPDIKQEEKELHLHPDLVEEKRTEALLRVAAYQQRLMKYYNVKV